jgi:serine/threonine-protein kinase RsbW
MENSMIKIKEEYDSEKKSILNVEPLINSLKDKLEIPLEKYYNILIAVSEAVNNAIIHGNKLNKDKKVQIVIEANNEQIDIIIHDEGEGFEPDELNDPRAPENLLKDSGRGVFLIKELSDKSEFIHSDKGTDVFMTFYINK